MDSILESVKKLIGIDPAYKEFDVDIITSINTVIMILNQMGIGAKNFMVMDESATWDDLLEGREDLNGIRTYMALKVKSIFDPPQMGALKEANDAAIAELEWRLHIACNSDRTFNVTKEEVDAMWNSKETDDD